MRIGSVIQVIASLRTNADTIHNIIGNEYPVQSHWKQKEFENDERVKRDKSIWIDSVEFGGLIELIKGEYKEV